MSKQGIVAASLRRCCSQAAARPRSIPARSIVELESPLARAQPLQGLLEKARGRRPLPRRRTAAQLQRQLEKLDERWGRQIAPWGYVTLTVDSFGPRGIEETCGNGTPADMAFDAYRALDFLVRQHAVDPDRVAVLGFSQGGWLALSSVEQGVVEHSSPQQVPRRCRLLSQLPGHPGQSDRAGADHDRRARRLDLCRGLPEARGGQRRLWRGAASA